MQKRKYLTFRFDCELDAINMIEAGTKVEVYREYPGKNYTDVLVDGMVESFMNCCFQEMV